MKKRTTPSDIQLTTLLCDVLRYEIHDQRKWRTDIIGIAMQYGARTVRAKRADFDALFLKYPDLKRLINDNLLPEKRVFISNN